MAENSAIEWTDHTFNPWIGCTKVGPGCDHCYAEALSTTRLGVSWGPGAPRRHTAASTWQQPRRWNKRAAAAGVRERVFCASLADVFDNEIDPAWRAELFQLIRETPALDWLLVTKRIGNAKKVAVAAGGLPANVWLGATIVNQAEADRDIPKLLATPAAVRFLSMEPLLGPVDLTCLTLSGDYEMDALNRAYWEDEVNSWAESGEEAWREQFEEEYGRSPDDAVGPRHPVLDWVIVGGESGPAARPMHPDWARALRDQCAAAGVPMLFKQWGEWAEVDNFDGSSGTIEIENDTDDADTQWSLATNPALIALDGRVYNRETLPLELACRLVDRVGKKAAGRLLDGVSHDGVPV